MLHWQLSCSWTDCLPVDDLFSSCPSFIEDLALMAHTGIHNLFGNARQRCWMNFAAFAALIALYCFHSRSDKRRWLLWACHGGGRRIQTSWLSHATVHCARSRVVSAGGNSVSSELLRWRVSEWTNSTFASHKINGTVLFSRLFVAGYANGGLKPQAARAGPLFQVFSL